MKAIHASQGRTASLYRKAAATVEASLIHTLLSIISFYPGEISKGGSKHNTTVLGFPGPPLSRQKYKMFNPIRNSK